MCSSFEEFCELVLSTYAPYAPFWDHILNFWKLRDEPNVLFIKYEDMKKDLVGHIYKTAKFLDKDIIPEEVDKLAKHLSFNSMKKNRATNVEPIIEVAFEQTIASKVDSFFGEKNSFIQVGPTNVLLPRAYPQIAERISDFKVRKDDVWLISLPRTGSTWTQEMVWLIGNNLDYEGAKVIQHLRTPLLELSAVFAKGYDDFMDSYGDSVKFIEKIESVRYIKTHLPLRLLPNELLEVKPKIVYVARNPKDMCVSYYYYCKLIHNLQSSFEEFCELVLSNYAPYAPFWDHILNFWKLRDEPNVLFIKYEDMKKDLVGHIYKTAKFLDKDITPEEVDKLAEHLSFNSMKKNRATNIEPIIEVVFGKDHMEKVGVSFIRKGTVGDYKNYMSEELERRFDIWTEEHLKGTGLSFD